MSLELQHFRSLGTGAASLDHEVRLNQQNNGQSSLSTGASRLASRLKGWFNGLVSGRQPDPARHEARMTTKHAFINALARSEGGPAALRALKAAGLPEDFAINDRPLTSRTITKVLDHAKQFRASAVKVNEQRLQAQIARLSAGSA